MLDSNQRPALYESAALTAELMALTINILPYKERFVNMFLIFPLVCVRACICINVRVMCACLRVQRARGCARALACNVLIIIRNVGQHSPKYDENDSSGNKYCEKLHGVSYSINVNNQTADPTANAITIVGINGRP
jgi:hypothetical protein